MTHHHYYNIIILLSYFCCCIIFIIIGITSVILFPALLLRVLCYDILLLLLLLATIVSINQPKLQSCRGTLEADPPTVHTNPHNMGSAASLKQKRLMFWRAKLGEWADNLTSEIDDGELQMFGIETIMEIANKSPDHMNFFTSWK